jgi:hypothetical protein
MDYAKAHFTQILPSIYTKSRCSIARVSDKLFPHNNFLNPLSISRNQIPVSQYIQRISGKV